MDKDTVSSLFKDAIVKSKNHEFNNNSTIYHGFVISIILTMFPVDSLNVITSFSALFFLLAMFSLAKPLLKKPVVWLLLTASIVSGCAGPFFHDDRVHQADFCYDIVGNACKEQTIQKYGLLGLGLQDATPAEAARIGDIKKVVVIDQARGYGIISLAKITVMGS